MPTEFRAAQYQIDDLLKVREIGLQRLNEILRAFLAISPPPLRPERLLIEASKACGGNSLAAEALVRQAVSLSGWVRATGLNREEGEQGIRRALQRDGNWNAEDLQSWRVVERPFFDIVYSHPVTLVAKAIDLSYEYANLYRRGRILTDVRPLFDDDAGSVEGAVVSFSLGLRFQNMAGENELVLALDEQDIRELRLQCERAVAKASTARKLLVERAQIPAFITGARSND